MIIMIMIIMSITYFQCMCVALVIPHAMRMHRYYTVICELSGCTTFSISHKPHVLREISIERKTHVLIFSTRFSETFLILRRIKRDIVINVYTSSCKVPVNPVRV